MMAARIKQIQAFMALTQMLVMPLFFLSGALYPLQRAARLADRAHQARPAHLHRVPDAIRSVQPPGHSAGRRPSCSALRVTWFGWPVPIGLSLGIVALMGAALLGHSDRGVPEDRVSRADTEQKRGRRRVATGANHPASQSSAFRRGPGTPAVVPRRGTRAPIESYTETPPDVQDLIATLMLAKCRLPADCRPARELHVVRVSRFRRWAGLDQTVSGPWPEDSCGTP